MKKLILLLIGCAMMHTILTAQNHWQIGVQTLLQRQQYQTTMDPSGTSWNNMPLSTELLAAYQWGAHWQIDATWTFRQAYELPFAPLGHLITTTRIEKNAEAALHASYKYHLPGNRSKLQFRSGIGARLGMGEAHQGYYSVKEAQNAYVLNPNETMLYSAEFRQGIEYGLHSHYWFMDLRQGVEYPLNSQWAITLTGTYTMGFQKMGGLSGTFQVLPQSATPFHVATQGTRAGVGLGLRYTITKSSNKPQ